MKWEVVVVFFVYIGGIVDHIDELYHIKCCIDYTLPWSGLELTTLVVIGTDCTGSYKSNYHTKNTEGYYIQVMERKFKKWWPTIPPIYTITKSTNKTDCHDITEILLKVALNTITLTLTLLQCFISTSVHCMIIFMLYEFINMFVFLNTYILGDMFSCHKFCESTYFCFLNADSAYQDSEFIYKIWHCKNKSKNRDRWIKGRLVYKKQ
jgi:hypothetical protein